MKTDYKLIPMSDIDDEARKLAVLWVEGLAQEPSAIWNKHKLASDIMNYASEREAELRKEYEMFKQNTAIMGSHLKEGILKTAEEILQGCSGVTGIPLSPVVATNHALEAMELYASEREAELRKEYEMFKQNTAFREGGLIKGRDERDARIESLESEIDRLREVLGSITLSMKAHPDCTDGSEFADMVAMAEKSIESLNTKAE